MNRSGEEITRDLLLMTQMEREVLAAAYEWWRRMEVDGEERRISWQSDGSDGEAVMELDGVGTFRFRVECMRIERDDPVHAGADGSCPDYGSTLDPCPPGCASGTCVAGGQRTEEPQWVLRTWADVVTGDSVRMPGTDATAIIAMRYRHPSEDPTGKSWHVVPSTETGPWAHTKDHFVQPGECVVLLDVPGERERFMDPAAAVEIALTPAEVAVIEMLGWANRLEQKR
jgi:hypothetical protein